MATITRMTMREMQQRYPLTPERLAAVKAAPVSADDNPFTETEWWAKAKRGRPKKAERKEGIYIRFAPAVIEHLRSAGKGWQPRFAAKVADLIAQGLL